MGMWKAVIIDDEKLIRLGLKEYIDWAALGVTVCDTCADGMEGLQAVLKCCPDLVITDIAMPNMDGVALLKQVRLHGLSCEFIFISAYSDFAYAKDAVTYGAFDYLLKPLEAPVLFDCVRRCVQKLSAAHRADLPQLDQKALGEIIRNMLTCLPQSEPAFHALLKYYGIVRDSSLYLAAVAEGRLDEIRFWLEKNLPVDAKMLFSEISESVQVFLLHLPGLKEPLCRDFREFMDQKHFCYEFCACEDGVCAAFDQCLLVLLKNRYPVSEDAARSALSFDTSKALSGEMVKNLNHERIEGVMGALLQELDGAQPLGHAEKLELCARFLENAYRQMEECYGAPFSGRLERGAYLRRMRGENNLYDAFLRLHQLLGELYEYMRSQAIGCPYTKEALAIIKKRYPETLTLKRVAKEIGVSTSHLSMVFKNDTGYSFSDYLFRHRMQAAQELIRQRKYKIYEVGARVGYPDVVQFSKRFKDHFHYSPKQWQKSTLLESAHEENG